MQQITPTEFYTNKIAAQKQLLKEQKQRHLLLGWTRLGTIVAMIAAAYFFWPMGWGMVLLPGVVLLGLFLYLVSLALATEQRIENTKRLIEICENEQEVLQGNYLQRPDGAAYLSAFKLPDNDLDLFGKASLFQYINRSFSHHGQLSLAKAFVQRTDKEQILQKQEAVKELQQQPDWYQQLQSYGSAEPVTLKTEEAIAEWLQGGAGSLDKPFWHFCRFAVPVVSFTALILFLTDIITEGLFTTVLILVLAFVFSQYKEVSRQYSHLSKIAPQLHAFLPLLQWIENGQFKSALLVKAQQQLLHNNQKASAEIARLKAILQRLDYRLNPVVHVPLSAFLFWDLQQVLALEKWKKAQTTHIGQWFEASGNIEMLASIATLAFNQPNWILPQITDEWFKLECNEIGHPLIKESKLVRSSFYMQGTPQFALITGSNMAGKSTFLRTVGANMVLAMAGAPVRAKSMVLPVLKVICSMRIMDNLEEETSTFYAELKKMKSIVEAANAGEKVFILIDEMLRGTNTFDRHTGSVALIRQLIRKHGVGIIASHDVALADLEQEYPGKVSNYHFDSTIISEEIVFDYKIKDGVCHSTNASLLMKKIGIEL